LLWAKLMRDKKKKKKFKKKITGIERNFFYYLFWKIERKKLRLEVWF